MTTFHSRPSDEIAPGVRVTRRATLAAPGLLLGAYALSRAPVLAQASEPPASDAFDALAEEWVDAAQRLLKTPDVEDPYLHRLSARIAELPLETVPAMKPVFSGEGLKSGPAFFAKPVFLIELVLEPGAVIRPHNHPILNVVTVGLAGECRYRHFEIQGTAPDFREPSDERFRVREMRSGVLTRGRMSQLSRTRDNIHTFTAGPEGARLLDFSTTSGDGDPNDFSFLGIDEEPADAGRSEFTARWVGKEMKRD